MHRHKRKISDFASGKKLGAGLRRHCRGQA
jgi:hypothetical protein